MKDKLYKLEMKAKQIKRLQKIANTILANGCYHAKESELQIMKAEKTGMLTHEEEKVVNGSWDLRNKLAKELIKEFGEYIKNEEENTN